MVRPMRPEDLYSLRAVGEVDLHPDGDSVVFTVTWPDEETDENRSQIHLHDGSSSRRLTEAHRDSKPRFSPSGDRLAFLRSSDKEEHPRPVVLEMRTGDVAEIGDFIDGAEQVEWLGNDRIVVRAPRRPDDQVGVADDELKRRPRVMTTLDYRTDAAGWAHDRKRQVSIIDLSDGSMRQVSNSDFDHHHVAVAPDGASLLVISDTDPDSDMTSSTRIWQVRLDDGPPVCLTPEPGSWAFTGHLPDGSPFGVGGLRLDFLEPSRPYLLDPTGKSAPAVVGPHEVNCTAALGGAANPVGRDGAIFAPGIRRAAVTIDRYDTATGDVSVVADGELVAGSFAVSSDGSRIVAAIGTPTRPRELWEFRDGAAQILVSLNGDLLAELDIVEPEVVQVPSTDGVEVEAFVVRPPASAKPEEPGPGLVYIHGGPTSIYAHTFFDEFQLAAAEGYTVIAGNPRGSDGYGTEWAGCITGAFGQKDWEDIQALTDHLAALAEVDPERIGIGGGSYGGFMAAWAIGHSDRYQAALVERAVINWDSFAGTSDIGSSFVPVFLEATRESDPDRIREQSPLTHAINVTTPTLIIHSEADFRCPIEQAEQLFAVLRRQGVDVTLVRFPGENHELSRSGKPRHRVERFQLIHEFFGRHLRPDPPV